MTQGGLPVAGGIAAGIWIRVGAKHFYCRGAAPDGTPRLIEMTAPPYGKTVYAYDGTDWSTEHVPFRLRTGTRFWLVLAVIALVLVPLMLSGQDPILAKAATPIAVAVCALAATLAQTGPLRPHDAISLAAAQEAIHQAALESQQLRAENAARKQAQDAHNLQAWAAAQWGQQAGINQALHPGQDIWRANGQSPPL